MRHIRKANRLFRFLKGNSALKKNPIKMHVLMYVQKKNKKKKFKDIFQILNTAYLV